MSAAGTAVGLLLLMSVLLAIAQWRGYHPIEGAIERARSEISERRSQKGGSSRTPTSDPLGQPETDGGREAIEESDHSLDLDPDPRRRPDRSRSRADDRETDPWAAPRGEAPVRPIRLDDRDDREQSETLTLTVPEGVEIEIDRGEP